MSSSQLDPEGAGQRAARGRRTLSREGEGTSPPPRARLTDGGDQGAGEEEGGSKVPVGGDGRAVAQESHTVTVGAQHGAEEALERGLGQAGAGAQEGGLQLPQLGPQAALVGTFHGRDDQRAQEQVTRVAQGEERQ